MIMHDPLKKYRRQFRAWKKSIKLKRELQYYHAIFEARNLNVPDEVTIRQATRNKFSYLKSKPKGNLNILAIYHHYNWENESLQPSLEKFGFVLHYDWFDEFNHQREDWHETVKSEMNQALESRVERWIREHSIDVIFTYISGAILEADTARKLSVFGIPMVNMSLNDKETFVGKVRNGQAIGSRDICRYFDLCWTSTEDAVKKYCVEGALPIYLPEGANPEIHKPHDVEKTIDVSFVGQCYGNRPEIIRKLELEGFKIEAFGYGWPNGALSVEEMVRMYSKSKINLGFGGVAGHKDTYCLKGRDFEIPMSGGLYLTEYHTELEGCYELGREIVTYTDLEDLVAKLRYLLANPKEAEDIRKRGTQRALREHTWEMRFEQIFSLMGLI
jgi:hypothetical protein